MVVTDLFILTNISHIVFLWGPRLVDVLKPGAFLLLPWYSPSGLLSFMVVFHLSQNVISLSFWKAFHGRTN